MAGIYKMTGRRLDDIHGWSDANLECEATDPVGAKMVHESVFGFPQKVVLNTMVEVVVNEVTP